MRPVVRIKLYKRNITKHVLFIATFYSLKVDDRLQDATFESNLKSWI